MSYLISCDPQQSAVTGGLAQAAGLFERFHCYPPSADLDRLRCSRTIPRVLVRLGELRGLIYRSDRGRRGCPRTFIHFMEKPPALACDPIGRQLYILGGEYRVTRRGIEG